MNQFNLFERFQSSLFNKQDSYELIKSYCKELNAPYPPLSLVETWQIAGGEEPAYLRQLVEQYAKTKNK